MFKRIFQYLFFIIILYSYLFNPYPIRGGLIKLLYPLICFIPFIGGAKFLIKKNWDFLGLLFSVFLYSFFVYIFGGQNIYVNNLINIVEYFFIPIMIVIIFDKYFTGYKLIDFILLVSLIASCISIFLILNPEINFVLRSIVSRGITDVSEVTRRSYGFSQFLLFTYPLFLGVIVGYLILFGKLIHYILIVIFLIPIAFNARTGFFPIIFSILFLFIFNKNNRGEIINKMLYFILLGFIFNYLIIYVSNEFPETIEWLNEGLTEVTSINNNRSGTIYTLINDMFFFPDSILEFIFGTGHDIYLASNNSDIGYINQIWFGGFLYMFLLLLVYLHIFKKIARSIPLKYSGMLFLTLLIANFKGNGFYSNELTRFLFLLFFYIQFNNRRDFALN